MPRPSSTGRCAGPRRGCRAGAGTPPLGHLRAALGTPGVVHGPGHGASSGAAHRDSLGAGPTAAIGGASVQRFGVDSAVSHHPHTLIRPILHHGCLVRIADGYETKGNQTPTPISLSPHLKEKRLSLSCRTGSAKPTGERLRLKLSYCPQVSGSSRPAAIDRSGVSDPPVPTCSQAIED